MAKIYSFDEIENIPKGAVLAYGHFTTIHAGHIRYLKYAKELGSHLTVALLNDQLNQTKNGRYAFNQLERAEALNLLSISDSILLMKDDDLESVTEKLNPKTLILGKEFENTSDENIVNAINIQKSNKREVQFHAGDIHYANADLLINSESELSLSRRKLFRETCNREGIKYEKLLEFIDSWNNTHLLVIGDTIVDQYAACEPIGLSAEAPVVVVKELKQRDFIGGAAIVASHIRSLGAKCTFLSVTGKDDVAKIVSKELDKRDIKFHLLADDSRPTTFKKRYLVENQKLFRVSRLEDHKIDSEIENKLINLLHELAPSTNGIVISDFVYGVLTEKIIDEIISLSKQHNLMVFGDLQCSSQVGDITKFKGFSLLCPNERESRLALRDHESGLEKLSQKLISITSTDRLVMKLGPDGFIVYDTTAGKIKTQSFPALSVNPLDVAGAGDSLLAAMATGLSSGQSMISSAAIACCMASIAVETMGNSPISKTTLLLKLTDVFKT